MSPDFILYGGGAVVLTSLFATPANLERIKSLPKKLNPFNWKSSKSDISTLDSYSIHEVLANLLARYQKKSDETGITLVASLGKHAYDNCHVKDSTLAQKEVPNE